MPNETLAVIDTGSANLASVLGAVRRLGVAVASTRDPDVVRRADRVVLPGVGAFGNVMQRLAGGGLVDATRERVESGRPLLAVCLGLQVLATDSEESPGVAGLGVLRARVCRFPDTVPVPQLGWNLVEPVPGSALVQPGYAYFANAYHLGGAADGWVAAWATHGVRFVAALERGPQLACQFHPELSGAWGAALLRRWMDAC
ncbi:MAG TPA: imidazole glycerol phosphate synthase subunit HisH [Gemmatimonadaceae bacterium]|nr:imidazole glycerol phosphate synthase subunit HisH [Gemmatimonadaceae bacterium]